MGVTPMSRRLRAALVWVTAGGLGAAPVAAAPVRLGLEQCLTRALEANPGLREAGWDLRLAEAQVAEAAAGYFPTARVTSITGVAPEARGVVHETPIDTVDSKGNLGPFTRVELEFVQPLFTWGKLSAGHRAAVKGLEQKAAQRRQTRDGVIAAVKRLYGEVLLAREVTRLLGEVQRNFEKAIGIAEERLHAGKGTITQADVLKLKIGLAGIAKEVTKARAGAELARAALAREAGVSPVDDFDISDTRLAPLTANLADLDRYLADVFDRSPEWQQLLAGLAAREAQVQMEESEYYPSVFIAGGFKYGYAPNRDRQLSPFAKDDFNFLELPGAALGVHWPLSFLQTRAKVEQARAELEKLRAQRQAAESGIRLAVTKAYADAVQTGEAMEIAEGGRKASRGLLVTSVSSFELGVGEAKDLFEALIVYTRATSDYYESVNDYNGALATLTQTVGEEVADLTY